VWCVVWLAFFFQLVGFENLVAYNEQREMAAKPDATASGPQRSIELPFVIVNTSQDTVIDCQMAVDRCVRGKAPAEALWPTHGCVVRRSLRTEYFFEFNQPFTIHDDVEVIKHMGCVWAVEQGQITDAQRARAHEILPKDLAPHFDAMVEEFRSQAGPQPDSATTATSLLPASAASAGVGPPPPRPAPSAGGEEAVGEATARNAPTPGDGSAVVLQPPPPLRPSSGRRQ
jgi:hypothetical protein